MKKLTIIGFLGISLCIGLLINQGYSAPEPSKVLHYGNWQLEIELHGEPELITVKDSIKNTYKNYWYLPFTVTNYMDKDIAFYPQFEIFTDTFQSTIAGTNIKKDVFEAIRDRYERKIPLLEPQKLITGKILQGKDYARDSVAVFEDFDPKASAVKIFLSGFSNETVSIDHPVLINPKTNKPKEVLLQKTLMLEYTVSGDKYNPDKRVLLYKNRQWIMR